MSNICPMFVYGPFAICSINPDFVQSMSMSKVCPKYVHIKSLSNLCPNNFLHSKAQNENPDHFFPSPKYVQYLSSVKNCNIFDFLGHSLDNLYICLSKCLGSGHILDWVLTGLGQSLDRPSTRPVVGPTLDWPRTGTGQSLDRTWIFCPTSVQPTNGKLYQITSADREARFA